MAYLSAFLFLEIGMAVLLSFKHAILVTDLILLSTVTSADEMLNWKKIRQRWYLHPV